MVSNLSAVIYETNAKYVEKSLARETVQWFVTCHKDNLVSFVN